MQNNTVSYNDNSSRRPRTTSANRYNHPPGGTAWNNAVGSGQTANYQQQHQQQPLIKNVWGVGVESSPVAVKRKEGGKRGGGGKWNDGQQDSGLAEDHESKIDISKAYQACLNKYSHVCPDDSHKQQHDQQQHQLPLGSACDTIGSNCSIYVTEILASNLFLGIENNKELKLSFQSLKKQLEQSSNQMNSENVSKRGTSKQAKGTNQNSFVCVNDPSEGLSRGFVVSVTNHICDVYLIDWGYINAYQLADVWPLTPAAVAFCRPLARLFEIAGAPADLPFPEGLTLPALFHVKVMAHNAKSVATIVKVKFKGRDLIDYYYEPALLKQADEQAKQTTGSGGVGGGGTDWSPKSNLPPTTSTNPSHILQHQVGSPGGGAVGGAGAAGVGPGGAVGVVVMAGDESSSATNSVVEEWLMNTADEQFSHFDEGPPSPTDDEDLANLMEQFELGDSVSAVHPPPTNLPTAALVAHPHLHHHHHHQHPMNQPNFPSQNTHNFNNSHYYNNQQGRSNHPPNRGQDAFPFDGGSPRDLSKNVTSISSKLNIKAGSNVKILISYVVLPTFFNFIPINQTTNKFREQLKALLNSFFTSPSRRVIDSDPTTGQPIAWPGQYFVSKIRGELRRVTVKLGHACLEKNKFVKIQDVDYGGELVARFDEIFKIPDENVEALKSIPVLRCNGSMNGLHPNSTTRRWSPEQCQSFRQLTESNILDATVARVTLSPQMSVPYYNFDLYFATGNHNQLSIADIMRAFEYAS